MYIQDSNISSIIDSIKNLAVTANETLMLLVGQDSKVDLTDLINEVNKLNIRFFGGIFPGLIYQETLNKTGYLVSKLPSSKAPILIQNLDSGKDFLPNDFVDGIEPGETMMLFVDGMTAHIKALLHSIYNEIGSSIHVVGAGAGYLDLVQRPSVFTNEGIAENAAVAAFISMKSSLDVQHGWEKMHGPLVATRTDKNTIIELNWEPAFQVYKKFVDEMGHDLQKEKFFDIAKAYPFGLFREGKEDLIRDPLTTKDEDSIVCIGDIPDNAVLYIMKGNPEALINSAAEAAKNSITNSTNPQYSFLVDCISRALYLEDDLQEELRLANKEIKNKLTTPLEGVLSLGEISSEGEGALILYNKTVVMASLYN